MLLWLKYFFYEQFSSWTFDRLIAIWGRDNKGTDLGKGWVYPNPNPNHNPNPNPNPNPNRVSPEATRIPHHRVCGRGNGGWQRAFVAPDRPPPWWGPTIFYMKHPSGKDRRRRGEGGAWCHAPPTRPSVGPLLPSVATHSHRSTQTTNKSCENIIPRGACDHAPPPKWRVGRVGLLTRLGFGRSTLWKHQFASGERRSEGVWVAG